MNRRSFFKSLGIGVAAVYLRIAPEKAIAVPNRIGLLGLTTDYLPGTFMHTRRTVFYAYPNGTAPLVGLLSLLKDDASNENNHRWFENDSRLPPPNLRH